MDSEVWDISAFRGCQKTTSAAAIARPALVGECRTPDRLLQVPPRGYRGVGLASKVKTTRLVHGKPTLRGHSVRGDRWPEQRYQSPPAARLDQDHRGGSGKNASGQLSALPRRRTMRRLKLAIPAKIGFRRFQSKRPSSNKSSAAKIRTAAPLRTCPLKRFRTACSEPS